MTLEHFQLLRSAGFPACGFRRLSSRLFRADQSRDKNVPQTRRQECLRYIKVVTALVLGVAMCSMETWPRSIICPVLPTGDQCLMVIRPCYGIRQCHSLTRDTLVQAGR